MLCSKIIDVFLMRASYKRFVIGTNPNNPVVSIVHCISTVNTTNGRYFILFSVDLTLLKVH